MPDTPADAPGTTFVRLYRLWQCPICNVWSAETSRRCEMEDCGGERGHVYPVVYECNVCHCIATPDNVAKHDCEMCTL